MNVRDEVLQWVAALEAYAQGPMNDEVYNHAIADTLVAQLEQRLRTTSAVDKHSPSEEYRAWFRSLAHATEAGQDASLSLGLGDIDGPIVYTRTSVAVQVALDLQAKIDKLEKELAYCRGNHFHEYPPRYNGS